MSVRKLHLRKALAGKFGGSRTGKMILGSIAGTFGLAGSAHANDLYWNGASSAAWNVTTANWNLSSPSGSSSLWTNGNTDVAHFSGAVTHTTVTLSAGIKADEISFENTPANYTLTGSNAFNGTSGGNVTLQSTGGSGATEAFNAPLNINGSSFAFSNSDPYPNASVSFGGAIGATTTATLTLNGAGPGTNTISGTIGNGAGPKLSIVFNPSSSSNTWKLTGNNTYTGVTAINLGTLIVANTNSADSGTGTGAVNMGTGTLASGSVGYISGPVNAYVGTDSDTIAPGGVGTVGTFTLNGVLTTGGASGSATGSTINFDLGAGPATNIGGNNVVTNGDLLVLGAAPIIASHTPLSFGGTPVQGDDYRLIGDTTSGTIVGGIALGNFSLPTPTGTATYSLSTAVDPAYIDLVVGTAPSGPATLTWNDTGGSPADGTTWDIANNQNWNNSTTASPSVYHEGDIVTFNDTKGSNSYNVTLNTIVHPTSVTVATAGAYSITGTGGIANVTSGTTPLALTGTGSLTLGGSNTYTGGTTVGTGSDSPTLILSGKTAFPVATALTVNTGATVKIAAYSGNSSNVAVATVNSLTNNGKIDITNNDLIDRGGTLSGVTTQVLAGLAGGNGITSSNVAGNALTTIAVVQAASAGTLDGATVNSGDIEVKYTYFGDTNLDGGVDGSDYTNIDAGFNGGLTGWANGDFNYDGVVDGSDYTLMDNAFNTQGASLGTNPLALIATSTAQIAGSAVPEPTTLGLLGIGAVGLIGRRRRQR